MNKQYFCRNFCLIDWRYKRLKNTTDLLLFYEEHFYGFSKSVYVKHKVSIKRLSLIYIFQKATH